LQGTPRDRAATDNLWLARECFFVFLFTCNFTLWLAHFDFWPIETYSAQTPWKIFDPLPELGDATAHGTIGPERVI
jgi:hypothetical protein